VRSTLLPYGRQQIEEADIQAVVEVLRSDWLTTGPKVDEFEEAFAARVGAKHAVAFSSGTAALHGAVFATGLGPGDEAITTPLTFCATANCVIYQGGRPIFADVCADTLNVDPALVASAVTARTRAILPVDYGGHPADMPAIMEIAGRHNLIVIEDASHALGATLSGKMVGALAHMSVFSFHPVKHVAAGEGGMVTTDDPALARQMRVFRNHGITTEARARNDAGEWFYEMAMLGYNYRLSDIHSALALSQLGRLDGNVARRRAIADRYTAAFRDLPAIVLPGRRALAEPAWHLYPIRLVPDRVKADRRAVFRALRAENIGVNVHYVPVHLHPYYRERFGHARGDYPVAEGAYDQLITLPMFHAMTDQDVNDVVAAVTKVLTYFA
jgi:perosamine synthetase